MTGARVQFEDSQGGGDDTAMNGLELKFETTADDFWERQQSTVENIVPIPFQCAEELFYSDDRLVNHKAESFVFQGCSSGGSRRALSPGGTGWEQIPGGLKHVSPGDADTVWGVNAADIIYRKLGSKNWENIPGKLNQINTAADGTVWGTTKAIFEEADWTMYQGNWGGWQPWKTSDLNYYACGANLRFEDSQGGGDDTAANGLKLKYCLISNWNSQKEVEVYPGIWGSWKGMKMCPANQFIVGAQVRYEDSQGGGDDTALNGLKIYCAPKNTNTGGLWVTVYGGIWGGWKPAKIRTNQNM